MKKLLTLAAFAAVTILSTAQIVTTVTVDGTAGRSARVGLVFDSAATAWPIETTWSVFNPVTGAGVTYGTFVSYAKSDSIFTVENLTLGTPYKLYTTLSDANGAHTQDMEVLFQTPSQQQTSITEVAASDLNIQIHGGDVTATVTDDYLGGIMQVYNLQGQVIGESPITTTKPAVTTQVRAGICLVSITTSSGVSKTTKIVFN